MRAIGRISRGTSPNEALPRRAACDDDAPTVEPDDYAGSQITRLLRLAREDSLPFSSATAEPGPHNP